MNSARLNSCHVLREEIKTYCECRGHAARNAKQKGSSHPCAFGKGKGKQGKGKGKQGQQGQQGRDRSKDKDKNKDSIEFWYCGKQDCWSKKNANKGGSKGKHKSKKATDAHNLDSKPSNVEPEAEIGGFDMSFLDVDALQQQESEWIKIGVDTGAGKTA